MSESLIYFVRRNSDSAVKIGVSTNLTHRLRALRVEHGKISLLGIVKGSFPRERLLHYFFGDSRLEGEFFEMTPDLQEFINEYTFLPSRKAPVVRLHNNGAHDGDLLTISQAADNIGSQPSSIRRAIYRGTLKAEKVGAVWIILRQDLDAYIANPPRPGPKPE